MTLEQITSEAMTLPSVERGLLAERMAASLEGDVDKEIEALWLAEAHRRRDELLSGAVKAIPREQAMAEVRRSMQG
jgi:putative addiction module component (TIGR02574 family)